MNTSLGEKKKKKEAVWQNLKNTVILWKHILATCIGGLKLKLKKPKAWHNKKNDKYLTPKISPDMSNKTM